MDTVRALGAFSALSQDIRLSVFRLLMKTGSAGLPAGNISGQLDILPNTFSSHLAILTRAGLLSAERHGRHIRYTANTACIRDLIAFLVRDCCDGRPEVCDPLFRPTKENENL